MGGVEGGGNECDKKKWMGGFLKQREVENYIICKNVLQKPGGGENWRGLRIEPGQW
jgi:hypothetical protein